MAQFYFWPVGLSRNERFAEVFAYEVLLNNDWGAPMLTIMGPSYEPCLSAKGYNDQIFLLLDFDHR